MYEFDRGFGLFLEAVRQRVPPGSSVAVTLPGTTPLYLYTAHFALAPRLVMEFREGVKADFLAVYGVGTRDGDSRTSEIPGGTVKALR